MIDFCGRIAQSAGILSLAVSSAGAQAQSPGSTQAPAIAAMTADAAVSRPIPTWPLDIPRENGLTVTAAAHDVSAVRHHNHLRIPPDAAHVPEDSIRAIVLARAKAWLPQLHADGVGRAGGPDALHWDDAGRLAIAANEDTLAHAYFTKRLAMPGLSVSDQAYTLLTAVRAFADTAYPTRLPAAEQYATRLDRLPVSVVGDSRYLAHAALAHAYYDLDRSEPALEHARKALLLVPQLPFQDRESAYSDLSVYLIAAHLLLETPSGRAEFDRITAALTGAATVSAAEVARDSLLQMNSEFWAGAFRDRAAGAALLGRAAPPLRAMAIWNMPSVSPSEHALAPQSIRLDDGVARLIVFGDVNCCIDNVVALQRVQAQLPTGAQVVFATATRGEWRSAFVLPADEVQRLHDVYRDTLKLTVPIVLWAGEKQPTPWGGMMPAPSPNIEAFHVARSFYGLQESAYAVITDGKGIIRHIFAARRGLDRGDEVRAVKLLTTLLSHS